MLGAIIAWTIAGTGMLMLAFVFQNLAIRKPDLDAGVFAYAKAGFGDYVGFNSAFGFWASGVRRQHVLLGVHHGHVGAFFPRFGDGDTVLAVALVVGVWLFHYLILRGVKDAAVINRIVTVAKVVPILVFILVAVVALQGRRLRRQLLGRLRSSRSRRSSSRPRHDADHGLRLPRHRGRQRLLAIRPQREDVGRATVIGFLSVLSVFALVTLLSYGVMPQAELARCAAVDGRGPRIGRRALGSIFISVGVIVSVLGAYLAWTLMAAEVLYIPANTDDMPKFLARTNRHGAPMPALVMAGRPDPAAARRCCCSPRTRSTSCST